eukprot:1157846-Pelagomonas_calceolata.AAC.2
MAVMTAHEARQASGAQLDIVLVDKNKIGGNSAKASSGMNALTPPSGDTPQVCEWHVCRQAKVCECALLGGHEGVQDRVPGHRRRGVPDACKP